MRTLQWSMSHAVFVPEIDDEHKEIFAAASDLRENLNAGSGADEVRRFTTRLTGAIVDHFAHEERLMRAARYPSLGWHKQLHASARRRVGQSLKLMEKGNPAAGQEMLKYLSAWLHQHTRLADQMMAAFLRNHRRGVGKLVFQAGTKPLEAGGWVDAHGEPFGPCAYRR